MFLEKFGLTGHLPFFTLLLDKVAFRRASEHVTRINMRLAPRYERHRAESVDDSADSFDHSRKLY